MTVDSKAYRFAIGKFATGVTVILSGEEGDEHGMTASAVTSVSLDPVLLLICVDKKAEMVDRLREAGSFSVNILTEEQSHLSNYFAGFWDESGDPEFEFLSLNNVPILKDALASLACTTYEIIEGGDHFIFMGEVTAIEDSAPEGAKPLLYYKGGYYKLTE